MNFLEARHAFITWWHKTERKHIERENLARLMHTSKALLDLYIYLGKKGEQMTEELEEQAIVKLEAKPDLSGEELGELVRPVTRSQAKAKEAKGKEKATAKGKGKLKGRG